MREAQQGRLRLELVTRTGFEPVISSVKGRRPKPLDQRASRNEIVSQIRHDLHGDRAQKSLQHRVLEAHFVDDSRRQSGGDCVGASVLGDHALRLRVNSFGDFLDR